MLGTPSAISTMSTVGVHRMSDLLYVHTGRKPSVGAKTVKDVRPPLYFMFAETRPSKIFFKNILFVLIF
jgi:hypothetical protein